MAAIFGFALALTALGPLVVQRVGRVIMAALLVLFTPVGVAGGYLLSRRVTGLGGTAFVAVVAYAPAATALMAILLAAALRAPRQRRRGTILVLALGLLAALAAAYATFTVPFLTDRGGNATPLGSAGWGGITSSDWSGGAALGVLAAIGPVLLGIAATAIVVRGRVRLFAAAPAPDRAPSSNLPVGLVGLLFGVAALLLVVLAWAPVRAGLGPDPGFPGGGIVPIAVRTWVPAVGVGLVQLLVAAAAGGGIGWFRPLGRYSMGLLYVFAPVLLLGRALLLPADYLLAHSLGLIDTPVGTHAPAAWPSAAAILVAAVIFAGLRERSGRPGPAVAALGGLLGILTVVHAAALLWPLAAMGDITRSPGPVLTAAYVLGGHPSVAGLLTPTFILPIEAVVLVAAVLVCLATRRLTLETGAPELT